MDDVLSDGIVTVRAPRLEEAPLHHEAVVESIPDAGRWLEWVHEGYALAESEAWIEGVVAGRARGDLYEFFVFDRDGGFLGGCGLNRLDIRFLKSNLGYWVRSSAAGKGVATAATRLVARFGFEELGLQRIEIIAAVENKASQRVAEKVGAHREGVLRNGIRFRGQNIDAVGYSLIPGEL
jgi:RimJ/RimL family protein N-acetyltransferase